MNNILIINDWKTAINVANTGKDEPDIILPNQRIWSRYWAKIYVLQGTKHRTKEFSFQIFEYFFSALSLCEL
jgi:hypothetical protein